MRKISTVVTNRNEILKDHKLTIGLELGDRFSHYSILDKGGRSATGRQGANNTKRNRGKLRKDSAQSDRTRNQDPFTLGQPAVDPLGARSDCGPCTQCAADRGQ